MPVPPTGDFPTFNSGYLIEVLGAVVMLLGLLKGIDALFEKWRKRSGEPHRMVHEALNHEITGLRNDVNSHSSAIVSLNDSRIRFETKMEAFEKGQSELKAEMKEGFKGLSTDIRDLRDSK
jgi:hypothetical protein